MRILPYRTSDDRIQGVVITCLNITERKQSDDALRESEEKFRAFVSATADVVYEMSADWREMHFLTGKEFIATTEHPRQGWTENYIPDAERARVWETIENAIKTKCNFELEHQVFRIDGTLGWTFSRAIPIINEHGEIAKWFGAADSQLNGLFPTLPNFQVRDLGFMI